METVNIKAIQLDLKNPKLTTIGDFTQNDTNIIKFTLVENGNVISLNNIDQILINYKKPNGEVISRIATAENNVITYQIGFSEMNVPGLGKLVLQLFKSDNRISTFIVNVNIKKSIESNFTFEETNNGLVDQVIQEINLVNTRIDNLAFDGVDTSKIATKEDLRSLATKTELTGLATKAELSQRVKTINGQSPDTAGNINITPGSGTTPGNVLLFEDWTPGEPVIIGDGETPEPEPPVNTAPSISSSFNMTSALTTTNINIPYSVTDAQGGNLTATYTKNGTPTTATIAIGSNTWNVGTLTAGSNTLKIKVTDSGGLVSNELTFTIAVTQPTEVDTTPPNNVTNLVTTNNTTGTSLTLTWTASTSNDVAGYEIYRGTTLLTTVTGTSYNVAGLTVNTAYTFNVKAKDTSNNVSSGTSVTATTVYVDNVAPILTITPAATFTDTQTVTMTANETATIYYTLDSTTPTQTSQVYAAPLTISSTTTVKAFAKDAAGNLSVVQTVVYTKETIPVTPGGLEIYSSFVKPDDATTIGTTDTGGLAWENLIGNMGVINNEAYTPGNTRSMATLNTGQSDGTIEVTFTSVHIDQRVAFRVKDQLNSWTFGTNTTNLLYTFSASNNGTVIAKTDFPNIIAKDGDKVKITLNGSTISVFLNGVMIHTLENSLHLTETKHGLISTTSAGRFSGFSFKPMSDLTPMVNASIPTGTYIKSQEVALISSDAAAGIYYTLNGSQPTQSSTLYNNLIPVNTSTELRYMAIGENGSSVIKKNKSTIAQVNLPETLTTNGLRTWYDGRDNDGVSNPYTWHDRSGNKNSASLMESGWTGANTKTGTGYNITSSKKNIVLTKPISTPSYTVELYYKPNGTTATSNQTLLAQRSSGTNFFVLGHTGSNLDVVFRRFKGGTARVTQNAITSYTPGNQYHLALCVEAIDNTSTKYTMYANGVKSFEVTDAEDSLLDIAGTHLTLGGVLGLTHFINDATYHSFRVYDRALSLEEVTKNYAFEQSITR